MRQTRLGYFSHNVITKISLTELDNICIISVFIVLKKISIRLTVVMEKDTLTEEMGFVPMVW